MWVEFYYLEQEVSSPKTQSGKAVFQNITSLYMFSCSVWGHAGPLGLGDFPQSLVRGDLGSF